MDLEMKSSVSWSESKHKNVNNYKGYCIATVSGVECQDWSATFLHMFPMSF